MAWNDAVRYVNKLFKSDDDSKQQAKTAHQQDGRMDAELPLRGRIGGVVKIQLSPLLEAINNGSLIAMPDEGEINIVAISRVNCALSGQLYRYYLNKADDGLEKYLQLYCNENGELSELLYCSGLCRIIPETVEEQQIFTGEAGYGLGDASFTLAREQIADLGWSQSDLTNVFGERDSLIYQRDIGDYAQQFIPPLKGTEIRIDDAKGESGLRQQVVFMPYRRDLSATADKPEMLWISTESLQSQNGTNSGMRIHVDFTIAIPLDHERVQVI